MLYELSRDQYLIKPPLFSVLFLLPLMYRSVSQDGSACSNLPSYLSLWLISYWSPTKKWVRNANMMEMLTSVGSSNKHFESFSYLRLRACSLLEKLWWEIILNSYILKCLLNTKSTCEKCIKHTCMFVREVIVCIDIFGVLFSPFQHCFICLMYL